MEPWESDHRLPQDTHPNTYDITLYPDFSTDNFTGSVTIAVVVTEQRSFLLLHTKYLEITKTLLASLTGQEVPLANAFEYAKNEFWVMIASSTIKPGQYTLHLQFRGSLTKDIVGFYRSVYTDANNTQR